MTTFMETKQIGKVLAVQRRIVDEYKSDMVKHVYGFFIDTGVIVENFVEKVGKNM